MLAVYLPRLIVCFLVLAWLGCFSCFGHVIYLCLLGGLIVLGFAICLLVFNFVGFCS